MFMPGSAVGVKATMGKRTKKFLVRLMFGGMIVGVGWCGANDNPGPPPPGVGTSPSAAPPPPPPAAS
jgi:hypothetical protein